MKKEEIGPATIYCGDCMEQMGEIQDGIVDMVLCDPPYSSGGLFAGDRKKSTREKYCDDDYNGAARFQNFSGDNMDQRSFTEFMRMVLSKCRQKAKPESVCAVFVDWRNLPAIIEKVTLTGVVAIEGNTSQTGSQSNGGMVCRKNRPYSQIVGIVRPNYQKEDKRMGNTPSPAHKEGVEWARKNGILTGDASGALKLTEPVTRQQLCTMLYRFAKKIGKA